MEIWNNLKKGASRLFQPGTGENLQVLYEKAALVKKQSGSNNPDLATIYSRIGKVLASKNDYSGAVTFYLLAVDIFEEAVKVNEDDYLQCLVELGITCLNIPEVQKSGKYLQKALDMEKTRSGIYSEKYSALLNKLIRVYEKLFILPGIPSDEPRSSNPDSNVIDNELSKLYLDSCAILKNRHGLTDPVFIDNLINFKMISSGEVPEPYSKEIREFLQKNDASGTKKRYKEARDYIEFYYQDDTNLLQKKGSPLMKFDELPETAGTDSPQALNKVYGDMLGAMGMGKAESNAEIRRPDTGSQKEIGKQIACSLYSVSEASPGDDIFFQLFAHLPGNAGEVMRMAKEYDTETSLRQSRTFDIPEKKETLLTFELSINDLTVDDPVQQLRWKGRTDSVQFIVTVPEYFQKPALMGKVRVSCNQVPIGHFCFKIAIFVKKVSSGNFSPELMPMKNYRYAFISYASGDRAEVMRRVQMLDLLKISYFQDVLNLNPGDRWDKELYRHIDLADVFFLFWSSAARDSEWVLKEVEYAIGRQRSQDDLPEIYPVILEGPPIVEPPEKLKHLHFNDRIVYFM
jgi:tetratricopeptide (TPR) repeat protein